MEKDSKSKFMKETINSHLFKNFVEGKTEYKGTDLHENLRL